MKVWTGLIIVVCIVGIPVNLSHLGLSPLSGGGVYYIATGLLGMAIVWAIGAALIYLLMKAGL